MIYSPSYTILASGGVVGSTVELRVSAHIPLIIPGGFIFGMDRILDVSAQATFRQEGW